MLESVAAQQLGQTALQHGDLLRASVHQRADEHDQAGAGTNLRIGLLGGKDATDAGDGEPVAILLIHLANQLGAGVGARAAGQAALPIARNLEAGAVLLQIGDGQPLHIVLGQHIEQLLVLAPRLVQRHLDQRGLRAVDLVERRKQTVERFRSRGERFADVRVRAGDVDLHHRGAAGGAAH